MNAASHGGGTVRESERLTQSDDGFRWIVGDLNVSHHTQSSYRVMHRREVEGLMTRILGVLMENDLAPLESLAQVGTRGRASAAAPSFRSS